MLAKLCEVPPRTFKETLRIAPLEFEEDDDSNGYINFVEYAENVKNDFTNLALSFFVQIEIYYSTLLWDRFEKDDDSNSHIKPYSDLETTQQEFVDHFKIKQRLEIAMLSHGVYMFYTSHKSGANQDTNTSIR